MTAPEPSALSRIRAESQRVLSADEVREAIDAPIGEDEREDVLSLVRWFRRRYPDPVDRLAYVRRAYARWTRL